MRAFDLAHGLGDLPHLGCGAGSLDLDLQIDVVGDGINPWGW